MPVRQTTPNRLPRMCPPMLVRDEKTDTLIVGRENGQERQPRA